ncbi:MAG: hypothetical protein L6Q37_06205, partial [Bdellovibrionaceae bacterium]|nr:hypothetical protein [Pseudobdellovibrionaceae bacterium]
RIRAMFARNQISNKFDQDRYFIQQMIHESFRMAEEDDRNYRYSDYLTSLYVSFYYGGQQVESFLEEPDLCLNSKTQHENCLLRKVFPLANHKPSDGSKGVLNDLVGAKFYKIEADGNTYITFRVKGSKLLAYQEYLDNKQDEITSYDCGPLKFVNANSLHCKLIYQGIPQTDLYFQIYLRKPRGAPAFLKVFIGGGVGYRTGWVK